MTVLARVHLPFGMIRTFPAALPLQEGFRLAGATTLSEEIETAARRQP